MYRMQLWGYSPTNPAVAADTAFARVASALDLIVRKVVQKGGSLEEPRHGEL